MAKNYVPLHCHSDYSFLDSVMKVDQYVDRLEELNMSAGALTEHGNLSSSYKFFKGAKSRGIKPIIGCEVYVTPFQTVEEIKEYVSVEKAKKAKLKTTDPYAKRVKFYGHLVLHALNETGYRNLLHITNEAFQHRFYRKPLCTEEMILKHSEGLHIETACMGSLFAADAMNGDKKAFNERIGRFKEVYKDRFSLEIQFNEVEKQHLVNKWLVKASTDFNIPLVYAPDAHYANQQDAELRDLTCAIAFKYDNSSDFYHSTVRRLHVKSYDEVLSEWKMWNFNKEVSYEQLLDSLERTNEIASWVDLDMAHAGYKFADMGLNAEEKKQQMLGDAKKGLSKLFETGVAPIERKQEYIDRLKYESGVILERGFEDYFLVLADVINHIKEDGGLIGTARGSAGGSLLSYCLGITQLDPIKHDLIFERFLNPGRGSLEQIDGKWYGEPNAPDIDVDINSEHKNKAEEYLKEKYGEDKVAHIITYGTFGAKSLIRDIGRVFRLDFPLTNSLSTQFENNEDIESGWKRVYKGAGIKLKEFMDDNKWMISLIQRLDGNIRNAGRHSAGVIVTPDNIEIEIPLQSVGGEVTTGLAEGQNVRELGDLGYVKYDMLGVNMLSIIRTTLQLIKQHRDEEIDIYNLDITDQAVFKEFQAGNTEFVFQFGSEGMRNVLRHVKPTSIDDLAACNALYRPGSNAFIKNFIENRQNENKIDMLTPLLEPILKDTAGIIIYQEQVLEMFKQLGGFSLEEADNVRGVLKKTSTSGKKDAAYEKALKKWKAIVDKFSKGCLEKGMTQGEIDQLLEVIKKYSRYSFNKSHSVAYAYMAYQSQWLRVYYPQYFYCALLTHNIGRDDHMKTYIQKLKKDEIPIVLPDVNNSKVNFSVVDDKIVCGLNMIKGPAKKDLTQIANNAPYDNVVDFFTTVFEKKVSKKSVDPLIASNACRHLVNNRNILQDMYSELRRFKNLNKELIKEKLKNLVSLYNGQYPEDLTEAESMKKEFDSFGFYFSTHPIEQFKDQLVQLNIKTPSTLDIINEQASSVAGLMSNIQIKKTRRNTDYAVVTLDDGNTTFIFKSWDTRPLRLVNEGDCAVVTVENSKYGWVLKRGSDVVNLSN